MCGVLILSRLDEFERPIDNVYTPLIASRILGLGIIQFMVWYHYGLIISQIPVATKLHFGYEYIGIISAVYFIIPSLISNHIGILVGNPNSVANMVLIGCLLTGTSALLLYVSSGTIFLTGIFVGACGSAVSRIAASSLPKHIFSEDEDIKSGVLERINATFVIFQSSGVVAGVLASRYLDNMAFLSMVMIASFTAILSYNLFKQDMLTIRNIVLKKP
jgi:hypothetical protein